MAVQVTVCFFLGVSSWTQRCVYPPLGDQPAMAQGGPSQMEGWGVPQQRECYRHTWLSEQELPSTWDIPQWRHDPAVEGRKSGSGELALHSGGFVLVSLAL